MKLRTLLLGLAILGIGFFAGRQSILPSERVTGVYNIDGGITERVDFEPFWEVWNIINERHAGIDGIDQQAKVWGAIEGLAQSLDDPYSVFLPPEESRAFEEMISGSFGGVGMEIGKRDGLIVVIAPLKGTPAEQSGVRAGDAILKIDDTQANDLSVDEAVGLIRGEPGTPVTLTMFREGDTEPRVVSITRDTIVVPTLETEHRADGVFVISLHNFDANASGDFRKAMEAFAASRSDMLLLDLRGNPGGYLDAAVAIASYFIPAGEVIVSESTESGVGAVHRSKGYAQFNKPLSMVVLVDQGSASASEILAGALQEHGIATLVGEQTFGKGSVQELIPITSDTSLKLTVAQWLTPNGVSISDGGLTPDVVVSLSEEDILADRDPQLDAALEILTQ